MALLRKFVFRDVLVKAIDELPLVVLNYADALFVASKVGTDLNVRVHVDSLALRSIDRLLQLAEDGRAFELGSFPRCLAAMVSCPDIRASVKQGCNDLGIRAEAGRPMEGCPS